MKIPPLDLKRQYETIKEEVQIEIERICKDQTFILGKTVSDFEEKIAAYCGVHYGIGVSSGTDALQLALMALEIGPGDEVITTPFTFIATAEPIALLQATPVFVDIDPKTYNIDPGEIEKHITKKTKAIIVVHIYGQTADMEPICKIAKKHNLYIIEDAAQAIGAVYGPTGEKAGHMGDIGCFSFFPSKNLGGFGDGGLVTTNDEKIAARIKCLRVHGSGIRYYHDKIGINGRLDALQAGVLSVKLKYLDSWLQARRDKAAYYNTLLDTAGMLQCLDVPFVEKGNAHTYHQYTLKLTEDKRAHRDTLIDHLRKEGIGSMIYYPVPLHLQKCFEGLGYVKGSLPQTEDCTDRVFSLPIFPELTNEEQVYIVEKIQDFLERL